MELRETQVCFSDAELKGLAVLTQSAVLKLGQKLEQDQLLAAQSQ